MRYIHRSRGAFALSIVLWIVAALLLGIAFIVNVSKENLILTKELHNKLDARLEAESVLEALKYIVLTSNYDNNSLLLNANTPYKFPKKIILDGRKYKLSNEISISLQDASSMLNVIYPNRNLIASFLTINNERELLYTIKDSIKDWEDKDNIVSLNGAESSFYNLKKGLNFRPRNSAALQSVNELRLINGINSISEKRWKSLKKYFYFGSSATVNLTLLDSTYLGKLLKLDFIDAKILHRYEMNDIKKFMEYARKNKNFDEDSMSFALSFKIKIDIIVKNHTSVSRLHAFIDFKSMSKNALSVEKFEIY